MKTWTLDDIRRDLAQELRLIHKYSHRYRKMDGSSYDTTFYKTIGDYIIELGHNRYERPERLYKGITAR